MTLEADFYAELSGDAGVAALVGDQIWPSHVADGATPPYIVYVPVYHEGIYALDGDDAGQTRCRLQVDCYAEDPDTAAAIARAVIEAIPESGNLHRAGHSNIDLGLEPGTRLFRRLLEFSIFHRSA